MQRRKLDDYGFFSIDTVVQSDGATNERFVSVGPTCKMSEFERFVSVGPTCKMSEFERFKSGSGVSLTLGLQHCEGGNFLPGETHLSLVSMTTELECIGAGNQQQRFNSPFHLILNIKHAHWTRTASPTKYYI